MSSSATSQERLRSAPSPSGGSSAAARRFAGWRWLADAVPAAIVVSALAGIAAWGHFGEWKAPRFSSLVGPAADEAEAWCAEHNVPEAQCIECDPTLLAPTKDYGWCKEHGVAQCPLDHPEVAQLNERPVITAVLRQRAARALALKPRAENNSLCTLHRKRIQFASVAAIEKAGVDVAVVAERPVTEAVVANGEVVYDPTRMAHLSSRVSGTVWQVHRQVGDRIQQGDLLALVDAAEIGKAKSEFLQAIANLRLKEISYDRVRPLADGVVASRQLREADASLEEARIRLHSAQQTLVNLGLPVRAEDFAGVATGEIARRIQFLGLPADVARALDSASTTSNLFPLRAPLSGVVIERHVVEGEVVDTNRVLFAVADTSRMALMLDVREEDAGDVALGQRVWFRPSSGRQAEVQGSVSWISTATDDQTRTVKVRVDLPNGEGRLRAHTFGAGRIVLRDEPLAIVVPTEAVHSDGNCRVVFVRDKDYFQPDRPKFFHVRPVRLGVQDGAMTEIIAGLLPGEVIASKNSVVLQAQLLKSNLGAGCGCADGH